MQEQEQRITVVVLTYNRKEEVLRTLSRLTAGGDSSPIIVVDNASSDCTEEAVRRAFPQVEYLALPRNIGTGARNVGVRLTVTPYVAFCDDDAWWEPASLQRAADLFDSHPALALLQARQLVGAPEKLDPVCAAMGLGVLPIPAGAPGPAILGFLAGSTAVRKDAFEEAGGFEERFFIGGEEELLAADLDARGWTLCYAPELVVHHLPSQYRDPFARSWIQERNGLWFAWMRRPLPHAAGRTIDLAGRAIRSRAARRALLEAARGMGWAVSKRRPLPSSTEHRLRLLQAAADGKNPGAFTAPPAHRRRPQTD